MNLKLIYWIIRSRFKPYPSEMELIHNSFRSSHDKRVVSGEIK